MDISSDYIKINSEEEFLLDKTIESKYILILYPLIVIIAKIVRWTIMKKILVDMSIGGGWIDTIIKGKTRLQFMKSDISSFTDAIGSNITGNAANNSIFTYQIFNIFDLNTYVQIEIGITVLWNIIIFLLLFNMKRYISVKQSLYLIFAISVLNIFDFCVAKEPIQLLYFLLIYMIIYKLNVDNKIKYILSICTILLSVISFRTYYILIIAFMISFIIYKRFISEKIKYGCIVDVLSVLVYMGFVYFIMMSFCKKFEPSYYNQFLVSRTHDIGAKTNISNILPMSNLLLITVDYIILVIRMLIPIELIRFGPKYWMYVIYQLIISIYCFKSFFKYKDVEFNKKISIDIFIGFLFASATFEPDFGSWVRHEAVLFPVTILFTDILATKEYGLSKNIFKEKLK